MLKAEKSSIPYSFRKSLYFAMGPPGTSQCHISAQLLCDNPKSYTPQLQGPDVWGLMTVRCMITVVNLISHLPPWHICGTVF